MIRPFYHYLMTERDPKKKDAVTLFANHAENDGSFPKQSEDYDEISAYLELNGHYLPSMDVFDEAWGRYIDKNSN
ncbi:YozE family protein [Marinilactibacillus sp. GCM10026970]|uniref:YozE family protein n=1 Tax=unclassified Marinilactibacillus TaxID=2632303 RepID=UPI002E170B7A|nr:YozE family protein [Marinilactibacillus sp. XAAS-LB27]